MIRINLLPEEVRKRTGAPVSFDKTKVVPVASLVLVLLVCFSTALVQRARIGSLERDLAEVRAESERYRMTIDLINDMVQKEKEINRRLALVRTLDKNRFKTVRVLDEVARRIPQYMWLTSMKNLSPDRVSFDGYAFSNLVVSDLMSNLDKSDMFSDVELTVVKRKIVEGQNAVNFTVTSTVHLDYPGGNS
jgi:type IV pilus assembly protein PilN